MNNLTTRSDDELRLLLHTSHQMLAALTQSLADRPEMQDVIRILMRPDDMLETFSELAVRAGFDEAGVAGERGGTGQCAEC